MFPLHCGAPEKAMAGKAVPELLCDIALIGNVYGERENEVSFIKERFGSRVKIFTDKFGKDFANVVKSAKVVLDYSYPFDDFYWSDRIYKVMACGGVFITQRTQGLTDEGFEDGKHYFNYFKEAEVVALLETLLDKRGAKIRKQISAEAKKFVKGKTYGHRLDIILNKIQDAKTENISVSN
jgi:spore maturation protein CgeB